MSYKAHQRQAHKAVPKVRIGILTASDSRTMEDDESGELLEGIFRRDHEVLARDISPDRVTLLRRAANNLLDAGLDVLVVNGGTGITPTDVTIEAFEPWFVKQLPGFGERFRALSEDQVKSGAWLSRATAGVVHRRGSDALFFLLPGSPDACRLAATRLILPELSHAVALLRGIRPHA